MQIIECRKDTNKTVISWGITDTETLMFYPFSDKKSEVVDGWNKNQYLGLRNKLVGTPLNNTILYNSEEATLAFPDTVEIQYSFKATHTQIVKGRKFKKL